MRRRGKALDIEHGKGRVRDGLAKNKLGVGPKSCLELLVGAIGRHEGAGKAHALHGMR